MYGKFLIGTEYAPSYRSNLQTFLGLDHMSTLLHLLMQ